VSDPADCSITTNDDDLPVSITPARDTIVFAGRIEQDYRFWRYVFKGTAGDFAARRYLDNPWTVSIITPLAEKPLNTDVFAYLQKINLIQQLGGSDCYTQLWVKTQSGTS
jgi:hypothetical protein